MNAKLITLKKTLEAVETLRDTILETMKMDLLFPWEVQVYDDELRHQKNLELTLRDHIESLEAEA